MSTDIKTIVVDIGSSSMKAGFGGEESPKYIFPSIIGRPKTLTKTGSQQEDIYISSEALKNKEMNNIQYPIQHGIVSSTWSDVEKIFNYTFNNKLHIDPTEYTILTTEAIKNPKTHREKLAELLFETFNFKSFCIGIQSIYSLYSTGNFTGICLEIGDGVTQVAPIYKGYLIPQATFRMNFGGHDVTDYLQSLLKKHGYYFESTSEKETVRDIKEKCSYMPLDYYGESDKARYDPSFNVPYKISDKETINIRECAFQCQNLLFYPHLNGFEYDGIDRLIYKSIMKSDLTLRKHFYSKICLSGSATLCNGFPEHFLQEVSKYFQYEAPEAYLKVIAPPERVNAAWIGASIHSSLNGFKKVIVSRSEYDDNGVQIVHRKCF